MKSAFTKPRGAAVLAAGNMSNAVPALIKRPNPIIDKRAGERSSRADRRAKGLKRFMAWIDRTIHGNGFPPW
ncbi:hypothetical protein JCM12296A_20510 [Desulfosarcina cetonica]